MKRAYLAICYVCNENCKYCPCSEQEKAYHAITEYSLLIRKIDDLISHGITDVTLSGGEPTLHPRLIDIIRYLQERHVEVTLLSNGELFQNEQFRTHFLSRVDLQHFKLITTIHSHLADEHDSANNTPGSFVRSIEGLKALEDAKTRITIKHCITKANYRDLSTFISFVETNFRAATDLQLCSIDYCGIPKDSMAEEKLAFKTLRPNLEKAFDLYESSPCTRRLYCINFPLCSCDPYYWKYLPRKQKKMYDGYSDPTLKQVVAGHSNVDISERFCNACKVKGFCAGTYITAYEHFGGDVIQPII